MKRWPVIACWALLICTSFGRAQTLHESKKLIATGWDHCTTANVAARIAIAESRPFDGLVITVVGRDADNKPRSANFAFVNEKWDPAWFTPAIETLKATPFKHLTDNFIVVNANPGSVDWFDDAAWVNVVEHWRIAARVAKQGGMKGLLFDPEPYADPWRVFAYSAQPQRDKHNFDDYYAKARQRGREVMKAIADEFPDTTLLCYFMNIVNAQAASLEDPRLALEGMQYGLYAAFIDGWFDATPPKVTFVDACEKAYMFHSDQEYLEAANLIRNDCQYLLSPENRAKYRAQTRVGFGIYLDAYCNPTDSPYYMAGPEGPDHPRMGQLRANIAAALRVSDGYVWLYGEKHSWWPVKSSSNQGLWTEALPGIESLLQSLRDSSVYAQQQYEQLNASGAQNMVRNAAFDQTDAKADAAPSADWQTSGAPVGWSTWQSRQSTGAFSWDRKVGHASPGSARAAGVGGGCFIQSYDAQPSERYLVRAMCRRHGRGVPSIRVRWKTADGKWIHEQNDKMLYPRDPGDDWRPIIGIATVPEGAGQLILLLDVNGQIDQNDVIWFDDVTLYRLP